MKSKKIVFTEFHKAELLEVDVREPNENEVLTEMEYTVVSGGTERANIMAMPNAGGNKFPKSLGYCGVGRVMQVGSSVTNVAVGDLNLDVWENLDMMFFNTTMEDAQHVDIHQLVKDGDWTIEEMMKIGKNAAVGLDTAATVRAGKECHIGLTALSPLHIFLTTRI